MCSIRMETGFRTTGSWMEQVSDFESLKLKDLSALRVEQGFQE